MNGVNGYGAYQGIYQQHRTSRGTEQSSATQRDTSVADEINKTERTEYQSPELSDKAKDLLKEMKQKYGNMDFFVADYSSDEEAQNYLSRGNKDYSVLIEPELLERMAADESVRNKYLGIIDGATEKLTDIREKLESEAGKDGEKGEMPEIKNIGFSVKADGSLSFFAEMEKSSSDQEKRIEASREEKKAQKKEEEKKAEKKEQAENLKTAKEEKKLQGIAFGDSAKELISNIRSYDWGKAKEVGLDIVGGRMNLEA